MRPIPPDTKSLRGSILGLGRLIAVALGTFFHQTPACLAQPEAQFGEHSPTRAMWVLSSTSKISSYIGASEDLIPAEAYTQAREVLSRALRIDPHNAEVLYLSGLAHFHEGRQNSAVKDLTLSAQMNPENPKTFLLLAQLERSKQEALKHFTTAINLDRNNSEAYLRRASLNEELGRVIKLNFELKFADFEASFGIENGKS